MGSCMSGPAMVCTRCQETPTQEYMFLCIGPGKYNRRWICESCLEDKLRESHH